jgi:phosphatidylcholine synthase
MSGSPQYSLGARAIAFSVHVLTASGVAFGLLALLAASERDFTRMFLWLGLALLIDGIDGPLARHFKVKEVLPHWSGEILDLVVDYLNYVLIPAYALVISGLIAAPPSYAAGAAITITGALYFADLRMKTKDAYFRGFPAVWNVVVFYIFVVKPAPEVTTAVVALFCAVTFIPVPFLHPLRVRYLRRLTLALLAAWVGFAALALAYDLSPPGYAIAALVMIGFYFLVAGMFRTRQA